jgi:hypothetical protein
MALRSESTLPSTLAYVAAPTVRSSRAASKGCRLDIAGKAFSHFVSGTDSSCDTSYFAERGGQQRVCDGWTWAGKAFSHFVSGTDSSCSDDNEQYRVTEGDRVRLLTCPHVVTLRARKTFLSAHTFVVVLRLCTALYCSAVHFFCSNLHVMHPLGLLYQALHPLPKTTPDLMFVTSCCAALVRSMPPPLKPQPLKP